MPALLCHASTTNEQMIRVHLRQMLNPVDYDRTAAAALQAWNEQRGA